MVWKCATFLESGRKKGEGKQKEKSPGCDNINLSEDMLLSCVEGAVLQHWGGVGEEGRMLADILGVLRRVFEAQDGQGELKKVQKEHKKLMSRKELLVEKLLNGVISDEDYGKYSVDLNERLKRLETKIDGIMRTCLQYNNYEARLEKIEAVIRAEALIIKAEMKEFLRQIHQIEVHKDGELLITFDKEGECRERVFYGRRD